MRLLDKSFKCTSPAFQLQRPLLAKLPLTVRITSDTSSAAFFHTFGTSGNKNPFQLELTSAGSFNISRPGPIRDRQDASHPHHAVVDPAGRYVFIPDLGADLIRMYSIGTGSSLSGTRVTALQSLPAVPGSGPRHGAFAKVGGETYFYSLNELGNTITGYRVGYTSASPSTEPNMTQIFHFSTHGPGGTVPNGTKAAEIVVSVSASPGPFSTRLASRIFNKQQGPIFQVTFANLIYDSNSPIRDSSSSHPEAKTCLRFQTLTQETLLLWYPIHLLPSLLTKKRVP